MTPDGDRETKLRLLQERRAAWMMAPQTKLAKRRAPKVPRPPKKVRPSKRRVLPIHSYDRYVLHLIVQGRTSRAALDDRLRAMGMAKPPAAIDASLERLARALLIPPELLHA